jgi:hypothetical protein
LAVLESRPVNKFAKLGGINTAQRLKHMFLSTLAASWLISGVCAQASSANEYVQAATCGSAQSTFFQTNVNANVTLDRKGLMWRGTNSADGDKSGLILFLADKRHVLPFDRDSEIVFDSITDEVKNNTTIILVFKPQFGLPNLVTVTRPLKEFRFY